MATFTVNKAQNIMDICLQLYGSMDYYFQFCNDNDLSIDDDVSIGDELYYDEDSGVTKVLNKIANKNLTLVNPYENQNTVIDYVEDGIGTIFTDGYDNKFTFD